MFFSGDIMNECDKKEYDRLCGILLAGVNPGTKQLNEKYGFEKRFITTYYLMTVRRITRHENL